MPVVGRLDQYASMLATEFDDYSMSENLILQSQDLSTTWSNTGTTELVNVTTAPDGTNTADKLVEDTSSGQHYIASNSVSWSSSTTYTFSVFAKAETRNFLDLAFGTSSFWVNGQRRAVFNLSNGTVSATAGPSVTTSITPFSNGWYRCSITCTTVSTAVAGTTCQLLISNDGSSAVSYTGDGTSGIYIWGAQVEVGSVATDYTPTTTTAINRVLASTTNTNITGLGTYYASGFDENVGFTTFLSANISPPYDPVYDEFGGTLFGAGQGRYMRQNTDKSVIVYNEIDEVTTIY